MPAEMHRVGRVVQLLMMMGLVVLLSRPDFESMSRSYGLE
jgi:hypothetical protein